MSTVSIPHIADNKNVKEHAIYFRSKLKLSLVPARTIEKGGPPFSWSKYQDELPSVEEINRWWQEYPDMGLAIITGEVSNVIVLDIDPRHGGDKTIKGKEIPDTWTVKTGGGGLHYYFKYPNLGKKIKNFTGENVDLPGVDLRASGGMAYAPPSIHPSGNRYEFAEGLAPWEVDLAPPPAWLLGIIKGRLKTKVKKDNNWSEMWKGVSTGDRNNTCVRLAGKLAHSGASEEEAVNILKQWNENNSDGQGNPNPLPEREVEKTVANIYRKHRQGQAEDKDKMDKFLPSKLASMLFDHLKDKRNQLWVYVPEMEIFYYYSNSEGYWRKHNEAYLKGEIRGLLRKVKPEWESIRNIEEVLTAFKHNTQKEKYSRIFTGDSELDMKHINVKNGMLDWQTGKLKKHKPKYFSLYQLPVEYKPGAKCPNWLQAMKDWIPGEDTRDFLQEFVGYCLLPDSSMQVALFLLGSGANGKSTFLDVLMELFGEENLSSIPLNRLAGRFETANLQSKLVNICSDIDPVYLQQTGLVKMIISGDKIRGEHKYRDSFEFRPVARLMFSANELPTTGDKTEGWYRRLKIIEFPNKFSKEDGTGIPNFKSRLLGELPGIFNWALEGLKRFKKQDCFTKSEDVERAKKRYEAENDSVASFTQDKLEEVKLDEPRFAVPKKYLYQKYQEYCEENGLKGVGHRKMVRRLKKMGFEEAKRRKHRLNTEATEKLLEGLDSFFGESPKGENKPVRCFVRVNYREDD